MLISERSSSVDMDMGSTVGVCLLQDGNTSTTGRSAECSAALQSKHATSMKVKQLNIVKERYGPRKLQRPEKWRPETETVVTVYHFSASASVPSPVKTFPLNDWAASINTDIPGETCKEGHDTLA